MRVVLRVVFTVVAVAFGTVLAPSAIAYAADPPSIAVPDVVVTHLQQVVQVITYGNLPAHSDVQYQLPNIQVTAVLKDDGTACTGADVGGWHTCSDLTGTGHIHVTYLGDLDHEGTSGTVTFKVDSLGVIGTGKFTYPASSDLVVYVTSAGVSDQVIITMNVFNTGPSNARSARLTVAGFTAPVNPSGPCQGGTTVTCDIGAISADFVGYKPQNCAAMQQFGPIPNCAAVTLTLTGWQPTRLTVTVTVTGALFTDPNPSNNSAVAFANTGGAQPPPAGPGGGGGGTAANPLTPPVASESPVPGASPDPSPTPAAVPASDATDPTPPVAGPRRYSYAAVPWVLGGAGGVLALGGIGGAGAALWLRRRRIPLPVPGPAEPVQWGLTVGGGPTDGL